MPLHETRVTLVHRHAGKALPGAVALLFVLKAVFGGGADGEPATTFAVGQAIPVGSSTVTVLGHDCPTATEPVDCVVSFAATNHGDEPDVPPISDFFLTEGVAELGIPARTTTLLRSLAPDETAQFSVSFETMREATALRFLDRHSGRRLTVFLSDSLSPQRRMQR